MFRAKLWHTLAALLLLGTAAAGTVLVYPFRSEDPQVGTAVAHAVATALAHEDEVFGPAVAPTLVPPFMVAGGFYNPAGFHADSASLSTTVTLQSGSGADLAVNGEISEVDGFYILELQLVQHDGLASRTVQAPVGDLTQLARRTTGLISRVLDQERVPQVEQLDLDGVDGRRAQAVLQAGQIGGLEAALETLNDPLLAADPYSQQLRQAISAVLRGEDDADPALLAALSLNTAGLAEERSLHYFTLLDRQTDLPAVRLWRAVLLASQGDRAAAAEAFGYADRAGYEYGRAARHGFLESPASVVRAELDGADAAALIVYSVMGRALEDTSLEKQALRRLSRVNPWHVWPFERLSFIAFDEDEALEAGQALQVAVRLEPDSDLYWTNLGWAQYLLGLLEQSEQSSLRATLLAPQQYIASYNLGLVRSVTGRLESAIEAYDAALRHDPAVEDAAIEDLEDALRRYPREPAVHYSLAYLLEAAGQRSAALEQYRTYLNRAGAEAPLAARAESRTVSLALPPPELQLPGGIRLFLGNVPVTADNLQAGDPLRPSFEVYTPGEVLPNLLDITLELLPAQGEPVASLASTVTLPPDTVGFVIDGYTLQLPRGLQPGDYSVMVTVSASEDREVSSELPVTVGPLLDPLRQLFGYGINLQSIESGGPLFDRTDLGRWPTAVSLLQQELNVAAAAADEVLPSIETGRFAGLSGGAAFRQSGEADLREFISYIAHPDLQGSSFVFVDTYAQWVLEGTPTD